MAEEDWPFVGENPEIQDLCESEELDSTSREMAYQLETRIGWLAFGLARVCTDSALWVSPRRSHRPRRPL